MANIAPKQPDCKSEHPDVYAEPQGDHAVIVANAKARRLINEHVEPPFRWKKVLGSDYLKSPEYRCVCISNGPIPQLMLAIAHQGGLRATFVCSDCDEFHTVTDEMAARFVEEAKPHGERIGTHPGVGTLQ